MVSKRVSLAFTGGNTIWGLFDMTATAETFPAAMELGVSLGFAKKMDGLYMGYIALSLYIYVYIYICMYVCKYVCMYV